MPDRECSIAQPPDEYLAVIARGCPSAKGMIHVLLATLWHLEVAWPLQTCHPWEANLNLHCVCWINIVSVSPPQES